MLTVSDKTTWLCKLVLYLACIPHNAMPKKISTKCNVFLQLIILRSHPHFTRHVRKKNLQNHPHFTRLKIRRSADPVGLKSDGTTGRRDRRRDTWGSICHGPLSCRCLRATDTRRDTGPWRCSSDGTDVETRLIARGYVVRHHVFNLKLRFVHH